MWAKSYYQQFFDRMKVPLKRKDQAKAGGQCWSARQFGAREILVSPFNLRATDAVRIGHNSPELYRASRHCIQMLYDYSLLGAKINETAFNPRTPQESRGNSTFDMWVDAYSLTRARQGVPLAADYKTAQESAKDDPANGYYASEGLGSHFAPWTTGDGIHFPQVVYRALLTVVMHQVMAEDVF